MSHPTYTRRLLTWVAMVIAMVSRQPCSAQPAAQPLYAYCSTADNQWVSDWPPIDSPQTVEALFDWLHRTWGVTRVYWRGEQDRMWVRYYEFRPENPLYYDFYTNWVRPLTQEVRIQDLAVAAARRHGMQILVFDGLFEHGAQGDVGGCGMFPYQGEDRLRQEHPQWCPVDRWGERIAPGPIELCYPQARQALVDRYVRHVTENGYDGICFYTYVENMGLRYLDEFGFNEPIVAEFRRRYGVDIRTQPFDKEAWHHLRGEYVTQFLRELHAALSQHGKLLSMVLRPDRPNLAQRWLGIQHDVPGTGGTYLDWDGWVRERIVDELFPWVGGDNTAITMAAAEACSGTGIQVVALTSSPFHEKWKPLLDRGVTPCTVAAPGYGIDPWATDVTTPDSLRDPDWRLRAQALVDTAAGKLALDTGLVARLVDDPHVLVRREAIRTLAALEARDHVAAVEAALVDPEPSVRTAAAMALRVIGGPRSPERIVAAVQTHPGFQFRQEAVGTLQALGEAAREAVVAGLRSSAWWVRQMCVQVLGAGTVSDPEALLLDAARDDDYRVRFYAVAGLAGRVSDAALETVFAALDDPTTTVQLRAAQALGDRASGLSPEQSARALAALLGRFRAYGDGCTRSDAAWGWRVVGNALLRFGDPGQRALEGFRDQRHDGWLAWAAYLVLHVPQSPHEPMPCDEAEAVATHQQYAPPFPGHRG